jgi:hypothetical protein
MVIAAMQDGLDVEREEVREWASDRLRERMLEKALSLNMKLGEAESTSIMISRRAGGRMEVMRMQRRCTR